MSRHFLLAVAVLLAGAVAPAFGQEVKLQWKFKEGDTIWVEDVATTSTTISMQKTPFLKSDEKITSLTSYTVKKVAADSVVLVMKKEDVIAKSDSQLGGVLEKIMEKVKGATFTVTITPDGKLKAFEGYAAFAKERLGGDDEIVKQIGEFLTEEAFKMEVEETFTFLPDKAVKKGDTWKRSTHYPLSSLGTLKSENTYAYNGKGNSGEEIGIKFNMTYVAPKEAGLGGQFKVVRGDLKAEQAKGAMVFDADKGRLASATMSRLVRGPVTVNLAGTEMMIDLLLESTGTTRIYDQKPAQK